MKKRMSGLNLMCRNKSKITEKIVHKSQIVTNLYIKKK